MLYLGIDPGVNGGLAVLQRDGRIRVRRQMPDTDHDLIEALRAIGRDRAVAVIERAQASRQMGVVSAFTYGRGFGALLMALAAAHIPYDLVSPPQWQRAMNCLSRGQKNVTKRRAQALFPDTTITHATADALLIAEFCRRKHLGSLYVKSEATEGAGPQAGQGDEADPHAACAGEDAARPAPAGDGAGPTHESR